MNQVIICIAVFLLLFTFVQNVEIMNCEVVGELPNQPEVYYGKDQAGYISVFDNVAVGDKIISVLVFNPLSPAPDALLCRIDFTRYGIRFI